jgi:hypothetical protein
MSKLVLTPVKFDGQFADGVLEMDGMAFDWNGHRFVVHQRRELYRHPDDDLCVSHAETGMGLSLKVATRDYMRAAKAAIAGLESLGYSRVIGAIDKARLMETPSTRLSE